MRRTVIKLGSSIVAEDDGELRERRARADLRRGRRTARAGEEVVIVSSGAIARGMRVLGLQARPAAIDELQAASAVGQGKLYRVYDELLREREVTSAQVLLTIGDLSARTHYLNARQTLRKLLDWRVVAVVNENDTTATDEISFGDNDFLAAQVAMLVGADLLVLLTDIDGLYSADPRLDPSRDAGRGGDRLRRAPGARDRPHDLAAGLGRDALEGGRRRHGHGGGRRDGDLQRPARGGARGGARRATRGDAVRAARDWPQLVQAVAEVREARARHARDRRGRRAGAARGQREPAPGWGCEVEGEFDAGDAVEIAARRPMAERSRRRRSRRASATTRRTS